MCFFIAMWVYQRGEAFTASFTIFCEISSRYGVLSMLPKGQRSFLCWFPYQKMTGFWSFGILQTWVVCSCKSQFLAIFPVNKNLVPHLVNYNIDVENPLMMNHQFLCILPKIFTPAAHVLAARCTSKVRGEWDAIAALQSGHHWCSLSGLFGASPHSPYSMILVHQSTARMLTNVIEFQV